MMFDSVNLATNSIIQTNHQNQLLFLLVWAPSLQMHLKCTMIRKLKTGEYRLYSRKTDPKTKKRRNLGTFKSREAAKKHEKEVQYFKRH
jgi:hypothetical protein